MGIAVKRPSLVDGSSPSFAAVPACHVRSDAGTIWPKAKRSTADGLLITLHNDLKPLHGQSAGRIVSITFSRTGDALATLDEHGQVLAFHLHNNRFSTVRRTGPRVTAVTFSSLQRAELFIARADGTVECIDTASKAVVGSLKGHLHAARSLACHPTAAMLLSWSSDAVILWDTADFSRMRAMPTPRARSLQHAVFLPSGDGLLTCAEHTLTLWRIRSFEAGATLRLPTMDGGSPLKLRTAVVSADSSVAVGAGVGGWLAVWALRAATLAKMILLPAAAAAVSELAALPADDGRSMPYALTCSDGAVRIVDLSEPALTHVIRPPAPPGKLLHVAVDPSLKHLAAVGADGSVLVYDLTIIAKGQAGGRQPLRSVTAGPLFDAAADAGADAPADGRDTGGGRRMLGAPVKPSAAPPKLPVEWDRHDVERSGAATAAELPFAKLCGVPGGSALLDPRQLTAMLRTCWAFPRRQRLYAWRFALKLPHNERAHRALLDKGPHPECERLTASLPLADRRSLARLERLLSCLAHWCPLFGQVAGLAPTVYPFACAFEGDDLAAFEATATVLANWGQGLYEFHPNPPVEVLRDADALLATYAPTLHAHLAAIDCGGDVWGWPLLGSLFARVLSRDDWMVLWDHLVCMEPVFFLFVLVAFIQLHATLLLDALSPTTVAALLLRPCTLQMRVWLAAAYELHDRTPPEAMPRWRPFAPLKPGEVYGPGLKFPTAIINHGAAQVEAIRKAELELARQRALVVASDEKSAVEAQRLSKWHEREAMLAQAEAASRKELGERRSQLEQQAAETALALKEQRLKSIDARNEMLARAQAGREREHEETLAALREQLQSTEAAASAQLAARAEEYRLLGEEAAGHTTLLAAQRAAQANAALKVGARARQRALAHARTHRWGGASTPPPCPHARRLTRAHAPAPRPHTALGRVSPGDRGGCGEPCQRHRGARGV